MLLLTLNKYLLWKENAVGATVFLLLKIGVALFLQTASFWVASSGGGCDNTANVVGYRWFWFVFFAVRRWVLSTIFLGLSCAFVLCNSRLLFCAFYINSQKFCKLLLKFFCLDIDKFFCPKSCVFVFAFCINSQNFAIFFWNFLFEYWQGLLLFI